MLTSPKLSISILSAILSNVIIASGLHASIQPPTGDVTPSTPWDASTTLIVGNTGSGSVVVDSSGTTAVTTGSLYLGYTATGSGTVSLSGSNSSWQTGTTSIGYNSIGAMTVSNGAQLNVTSSNVLAVGTRAGSSGNLTFDNSQLSAWRLIVGSAGTGALNVQNGSTLTMSESTYIGMQSTGAGSVNFSGTGNTLTTRSFYGSSSQLSGSATIYTRGIVSDTTSLYIGAGQLNQTFSWYNNTFGTINVHLDLTGTTGAAGDLGAGYRGTGNLQIGSGAKVNTVNGYLGYHQGSNGTATVSDSGTEWNNSNNLYVGYRGTGTLNLSAKATASQIILGNDAGSSGTVNVQTGGMLAASDITRVGLSGTGVLNITGTGTAAFNGGLDLGHYTGATGTLKIDGSQASASVSGDLLTGFEGGKGQINLWNRSTLNVTGTTQLAEVYLGSSTDSGGNLVDHFLPSTLNFGTDGGTLTTGSLLASWMQLQGTGTINTHGMVSDVGLTFDVTKGTTQQISLPSAARNVKINLNVDGTGIMGAGYYSSGAMSIRDGVVVNSTSGYLGYYKDAHGFSNIDGAGSKWAVAGDLIAGREGIGAMFVRNGGSVTSANGTIGANVGSNGFAGIRDAGSNWTLSGTLTVGNSGSGTMTLFNGGKVHNTTGVIASAAGSTGVVNVDGNGSIWTNTGNLYVGSQGTGTLNIRNGGQVSAANVYVRSGSLLSLDVGTGSLLDVGAGSVSNNGTFRFTAAAGLDAGSRYKPLNINNWNQSSLGNYQTLGGTWDAVNHEFVVAGAVKALVGSNTQINLSSAQRVALTDSQNIMQVGASFQATSATSGITFSANSLSDTQSTGLSTALKGQGDVVTGWQFSAEGYQQGDAVLLSMQVDPGFTPDALKIWHYDATNGWQDYSSKITDLTVIDGYANFTVTGFSSYALVSTVPEPAGLTILAAGTLLMLRRQGRR